MDHHLIAQFLGVLAVILVVARLFGMAARAIGQPAVLGELLAGVVLGASVFGLIRPDEAARPGTLVLGFLSELGVVVLLFEIGLETDLTQLLRAGSTSTVVAVVGVVLPFAGGYLVCHGFGQDENECILAGAALTATSVGITARVLNDLGRLHDPESQIVLGAAVIDDVLGLIILTVVSGLSSGKALSRGHDRDSHGEGLRLPHRRARAGQSHRSAAGPPAARHGHPRHVDDAGPAAGVRPGVGADAAGSASIIGAFAAGLLLRRTPQARDIESAVLPLGHFFVPLFFIFVGASVDVRTFVPRNAAGWQSLEIGAALIVVAVLGKLAAGYAPFWFRGRKSVVGVGMVPRGEVGLIFAQMGRQTKVFDPAMFSAVTLMVMVTTFLAPPLLRVLFPPVKAQEEVPPEP